MDLQIVSNLITGAMSVAFICTGVHEALGAYWSKRELNKNPNDPDLRERTLADRRAHGWVCLANLGYAAAVALSGYHLSSEFAQPIRREPSLIIVAPPSLAPQQTSPLHDSEIRESLSLLR